MIRKSFCLWFWILIIPATILFAQDKDAKEKEKSTSEVVITQEDFIKNNCENVGDALQTITGVYINAEGEVSLRDVSASKVVIIMDGQRLNTPGSTGVNIASLPIQNVEKIELLRGGRSAQYGADAVGGVILITTKGKEDNQKALNLSAKASYGSYNRQIYNLSESYGHKKLNSFVSYQRETWDGDFTYLDYYGVEKTLINNKQSSHNVFGKVGYSLDENQQLSTSANWYYADNGTPGMIDNLTPNARLRLDNKSYNLTYNNKKTFKDFSLKAQSYFLDLETKFDNPDAFGGAVHSDHNNYALGLELSQSGSLGSNFALDYGYSFRNDRIKSTDVGKKQRNTNSAHIALSAHTELPEWVYLTLFEASIAARYDAPTDFRSATSPRLSASMAHKGTVSTTLMGHVAQSYKAPSFNDLYWPQDAFAVGNPDLVPEDGFNYDVGLSFNYSALSIATNYFRNDINNLILWEQDPELNNLWTPKNISKSNTYGIETSVNLDLFNRMISLNSEYTYMKALDKGPDPSRHNRYITYRPKNKLDLTGTLRIWNIEWNAIYHYKGLRFTNAANTKWLPAYHTIDTNLTYKFNFASLQWVSIFEMSNLTDESYMQVLGTAEPGQMYKISFGANF
jgi:outer membrane cobalamin receptor